MEQIFIDFFIPNATLLNLDFPKGIQCCEYSNTFYILVNTQIAGLITASLKKKIGKKLKNISNPILYISMFKKRADFIRPDEIAWDSYVWFEDNPKHFIHFEKNSRGVKPYPKTSSLHLS